MEPRLIIFNGPLGIGKSTMASKFADEYPGTLNLDIDEIRRYISHWREKAEQSATSSKQMALTMAKVHLSLGHDVVVPQIMRSMELFDSFENVAIETGAKYYEFLLFTEKMDAIRRFKERSYAQGYESGFRPGGLIDTGGRENKLSSMYDEMLVVSSKRPHTIRINVELGKVDETYKEIKSFIGS